MSGAHGTWQQTGGGGPGPLITIAAAVLILAAVAGGGTAAGGALVALAIWLAGVLGTVLVLAAAAWLLTRRWRAQRRAAADTARAERERAIENGQRQREEALHQRRLEISRASAPVVNVTVDPAALIAAALRGQEYQAHPVPVMRGEVESP
jgi:ABC-type nickel/cobalt efflux system permease component RcnA